MLLLLVVIRAASGDVAVSSQSLLHSMWMQSSHFSCRSLEAPTTHDRCLHCVAMGQHPLGSRPPLHRPPAMALWLWGVRAVAPNPRV
jgi:hypothetical protein